MYFKNNSFELRLLIESDHFVRCSNFRDESHDALTDRPRQILKAQSHLGNYKVEIGTLGRFRALGNSLLITLSTLRNRVSCRETFGICSFRFRSFTKRHQMPWSPAWVVKWSLENFDQPQKQWFKQVSTLGKSYFAHLGKMSRKCLCFSDPALGKIRPWKPSHFRKFRKHEKNPMLPKSPKGELHTTLDWTQFAAIKTFPNYRMFLKQRANSLYRLPF